MSIQAKAKARQSDRQISQTLKISVHTVRKWRRKLNAGQGLDSPLMAKRENFTLCSSHMVPSLPLGLLKTNIILLSPICQIAVVLSFCIYFSDSFMFSFFVTIFRF